MNVNIPRRGIQFLHNTSMSDATLSDCPSAHEMLYVCMVVTYVSIYVVNISLHVHVTTGIIGLVAFGIEELWSLASTRLPDLALAP